MSVFGVQRRLRAPWFRWADPKFQRLPFAVGGPLLTALFWSVFAIFIVGLWLTPVLPFGDYHYHLSLAAILRRMMSAHSIERHLYDTDLISYNSSFHILVAVTALVMPVERAGLVVYSGCWLGLCLTTLSLLRALKQPTERAFIVFPIFLAVPFAWGFVNYCTGLVLQLYALSRVIRRPRVDASIRYDVVTGVIAVLGLLSHLFASSVVYVLVFVALVVRTMADGAPHVVRYLRTLREGLPFVPPILVAIAIYFHEEHSPARRADTDRYGDFYGLAKAQGFLGWACDFFADHSDQRRLCLALAILSLCAILRARRRQEAYPTLKVWLFCAAVVVYLLMPEFWWGVAVLFQRLPLVVVIFFALVLPRAPSLVEKGVALAIAVIGAKCAFAFLGLRLAQLPDIDSLTRVIDEAPAGRRLAIHAPYVKLERQNFNWAGHLAPYYVTRKGLESSVNYARQPTMPVQYRGAVPPLAADAVAQGGQPYDPRAPYAKRFDLVLVRTLDANPAAKIWGARAGEVDLVSHHGNWWLFDARRYFQGS